MDCNLPGSSVHGILQAGILKWAVIFSSRGSFQPRDQTRVSYISCIGKGVLYHRCHLGIPEYFWEPVLHFRTISKNPVIYYFKINFSASLVVQWLRMCLPMQRTCVGSLLWEDPTCCRASKPVHHNYCASALELASHNYWALMPQMLKPACPRAHAPRQEKPQL